MEAYHSSGSLFYSSSQDIAAECAANGLSVRLSKVFNSRRSLSGCVTSQARSNGEAADTKTVGATLRALQSKNRAPKKWLGQHYMVNDAITQRTVEAAEIKAGDLVLEVGTGTGALTQALVDAGAHVIGVEKDMDMVSLTRERFAHSNKVQIFHDDFLKWPLIPTIGSALDRIRLDASLDKDGLPLRAKVVANLPFNITTDVIRRVLPLSDMFSTVVLMLQDEAAKRLVDAAPRSSEYRRMNFLVHFFSYPKYNFFVDRMSFLPPPKVNAAVVSFTVKRPLEHPKVSSHKAFFSMVDSAFAGKRKMLRNSLQPIFQPWQVVEALEAIGLPLTARPEELTLGKFVEFFNMLETISERSEQPETSPS